MAGHKITIKEVARFAGVSKTTVSHALSGKRPVSGETKLRIEKAINELQYYPNYMAQSLVSKRSGIIGMIYPTPLSDSNHRESVEFIFNAAKKTNALGYKFLLLTGEYEQEYERIMSIIRSGHIDGVVLMDIRMNDLRVDLLYEEKFPFVMIGRNKYHSKLNYVDIDATEAIYKGTRYLISLGHKEIVFFGISPRNFGFTQRGLTGYKKALEEAGIQYKKELTVFSPSDEIQSCNVMKSLIGKVKFSAVMAAGDMLSIGAIDAFRTSGIKIPEEMSVITFGNSSLCTMITPKLSALSVRYKDMSELAVEMLIKTLNNDNIVQNQILLKPDLIIRETTGPALK